MTWPRRHARLVDMFEVEGPAGRRVEVLRYRSQASDPGAEDSPAGWAGRDEWIARSGERFASKDGEVFHHSGSRYVRVGKLGVSPAEGSGQPAFSRPAAGAR